MTFIDQLARVLELARGEAAERLGQAWYSKPVMVPAVSPYWRPSAAEA